MSRDFSKAALKEARELFKKKEYNRVVKICKEVLEDDDKNYNALVLIGAALWEVKEHRNHVRKYLKKAINIQQNNPLAWRGLCLFYENEESNDHNLQELITIYKKLLQIESEFEKFVQYSKSLLQSLLKRNNEESLKDIIAFFSKLLEENKNENVVRQIYENIISLITQFPNITISHYENIIEQAFNHVLQDEKSENRQDYYKKYLKLLYSCKKFQKLLTESVNMHNLYNQDIYPLEWICRVYSEMIIEYESCENFNIVIYYETLLDHDHESIFGYFAKSVHLYEIGKFVEARDILSHLVDVKSKWFHAWFLLSKIDAKIHCWEDSEAAAQHALKLMNSKIIEMQPIVNLIYLESLIKSPSKIKWKLAKEKFQELSNGSEKSLVLEAHLYSLLDDTVADELINKLINTPKTRVEATILKANKLYRQKSFEEAADILGSILETSEAWLLLGKVSWEMADYGHSLMAFLKAIHQDPYNWECLVYLGNYYKEHTDDYERAKKCYQKALQINPNSEKAGIGLSLINRMLKNNEENIEFLKKITSQGTGPKWALMQLGLQHLEDEDAEPAIVAFRNAIKIDPSDEKCWECLGDAYLCRGAFMSGLRSYERALELNPESTYPSIQISNIKLMIGEYSDAKSEFEKILENHSNSIPALKGIAECCFHIGKLNASKQLLARARDDFQESLDYITKAIIEESEFSCNWKILGDILYNTSKLPEKYCYLYVVPGLMESDSQENIKIILSEILKLGVRCFSRALNLMKSSYLWHDLACCYFAQLCKDPTVDVEDIKSKCLATAKESIKLRPDLWSHWNLLGVICMSNEIKNYALAQHCFVMAIEQEDNNPVPWANLGFLYFILDDPFRANEAFSWAQRVDPSYINSWIGQALIAENVSQVDAIDLFRHCTDLSYHDEAALGYAYWVITSLLNPETKKDSFYNYIIEKMHATTVATDSVNWYTVHHPNNPQALNMFALLLERQNLFRPAFEKLSTALKYVRDDKQKDILLINLSRIKLKLNKFQDSIEYCKNVKEASFQSSCQLALSLFKAENFKESYEIYEEVLQYTTENKTNMAYVLCAMASMAFMFQESNDTKTLLFQAVGIQPPVAPALLALAALGMLDGDKDLTRLALKELKLYDDHPEYKCHVAKLSAYSFLLQNDTEGAARLLSKYVHKYPDSPELWSSLAETLLKMSDISFSICAQKALYLGRNLSVDYIAKITCISALSTLIKSEPEKGLRFVLNTVHSFPGYSESWANLIAALLPEWCKVSKFRAHWLMVLASKIRNGLLCTRNMEQWLLKNEKQANDIAYC